MSLTKATYSMIDGAPVNVLDYGAVGDGVADDTAAFQAAANAAIAASSDLYIPSGTFYCASKITFDLRVSGSPTLSKYVKVRGSGSKTTTMKFGADGFEFIGAASAGVNNGDHRLFVERFSVAQPAIDRTVGTAIKATDMSGLCVDDVLITGFLIGVDLEDVLVSQFFKLKVEYADIGLRSAIVNYSRLNLTKFSNCSFASCWTNFVNVQGTNLEFDTCGFEGLGLDLSGSRGDYLARGLVATGSPDGFVALRVGNSYFENNKGEADVYIDAFWTGGYTFSGCNFNRANVTRYTESNVILASSATGTEQHAIFDACGFLSVGTYVPDVSRPKISVQNTGGFDNWFVKADRLNIGLFSGVDAFSINDPSVKRFYRATRAASGAYSPVIEGDISTPGVGTYIVQNGIYERIGDMVFFSANIEISAHTGVGTFKISLPPIAPALVGPPIQQPVSLTYAGPAYSSGNVFTGILRPDLNTTVGSGSIQLAFMDPAGTLNGAIITNAAYEIFVSGSYFASV